MGERKIRFINKITGKEIASITYPPVDETEIPATKELLAYEYGIE